MEAPLPVPLRSWIDSVRPSLAPPVGNKLLFGAGQHKVMVVGGPNERLDFHVEEGEEFFLQLEGELNLIVVEGGSPRAVRLREGDAFLLPARVPHSPQRGACTVGLVLERERVPGEVDALRWYTPDGSGRVLYEETFFCADLGRELPPVISRFKASDAAQTGEPAAPGTVGASLGVMGDVGVARMSREPFSLSEWAESVRARGAGVGAVPLYGRGAPAPDDTTEYNIIAQFGGGAAGGWQPTGAGEVFIYQVSGRGRVRLRSGGAAGEGVLRELAPQDVLLVPAREWEWLGEWDGEEPTLALVFSNSKCRAV